VQTFCFNSLAINNKKAFAETSPVEPDAVSTAVGKSLQLPYIFYRPINRHSLLKLCCDWCDK